MKAIFNKIMIGAALLAGVGMTSCVGDLDQLPKDPNTMMANSFKNDPKEYIGELLAKCYLGLAVSGQNGPNGGPDIEGADGGTFQWTRACFYLNEFPTDEAWWIYYTESGIDDMLHGTWGVDNDALYATYSRLYCHISVCNDFIRTMRNLDDYGVKVGGSGENAISQATIDQFVREARALRDLSYFQVIDFWGRATVAWDNQKYGDVPPQAESRDALFRKVLADLEDVEANWDNGGTQVYGRISRESVQALLCRFYLNAEVFSEGTMTDGWQKCWAMAQKIIANHEGNNAFGGLVPDYLAVFSGSNKMFMPGGSLANLNEILWGIAYDETYTQAYGGPNFLVSGPVINHVDGVTDPSLYDGFCSPSWYMAGSNGWGCSGSRKELNDKFGFVDGVSTDARTALWLTTNAGYNETLEADHDRNFYSSWKPLKFTNCQAEADGSMPVWQDPATGLNRVGKHTVNADGSIELPAYGSFPNTNVPLIRLADVYLMAAEAYLHGAGNQADAMKYVNYVRSRAHATPLTNAAELTKQFVLDERARELYWEGTRRTDLIRNDQFCSGYNWTWKGGVYSGTQLEAYRKVFPIPQNIVTVYGKNIQQNPGY